MMRARNEDSGHRKRTREVYLLRLLRQPLVQFLLLGSALFALHAFFGTRLDGRRPRIVVTAERIEMFSAAWERQWQRPPSPEELDGLIESHLREEILFRKALEMGLDRDDTVVRRQLAQRVEFLAQATVSEVEPSEQELIDFFDERPEIFEVPRRITFSHVYISRDEHGTESETLAREALSDLQAGADPTTTGDRFALQRDYLRKSPAEVARHFGGPFTEAVFELQQGSWQGPLPSGYGQHLVLVKRLEDAYVPSFEEVQTQVREEYFSYRRREVDRTFYDQLRSGYEIVIEEPSVDSARDSR